MNNLIEQYLDEFFKELQHTPGPWRPHEYNEAVFGASSRVCVTVLQGGSAKPVDQANCKLISRAPDMLRSICRTYLTLLVKFAYGQNDFCTSARISLNDTLASLRNEISNATGLESRHLQDTFEDYVVSIKEGIDIKQHSAWVKQGRPGEPQITK